jgi:hypothetical protein
MRAQSASYCVHWDLLIHRLKQTSAARAAKNESSVLYSNHPPRYAPIFAIASPVTWPPASVTLHRGRYIFARTAQETSDNTAYPNYRSSSCMMHMYFHRAGLSGTRMTVCSSLPPPVRHESRCATLPSIGHSLAELKSFIFAAL